MKNLTKELRQKLLDELEGRAHLFSIAVAPLYAQLGWWWAEKGVPNTKEIENHILEQISDLRARDGLYSLCGGLKIQFENVENNWEARLSFIFETTVYE